METDSMERVAKLLLWPSTCRALVRFELGQASGVIESVRGGLGATKTVRTNSAVLVPALV